MSIRFFQNKAITLPISIAVMACAVYMAAVPRTGTTAEVESTPMYSTGDILNARAKPSMSAPIVVQIPYGSIVNVAKTDVRMTYEGMTYHWYRVKEVDAYVLGAFLSVKRPSAKKEMKLCLWGENEGCPAQSAVVRLSGMKASSSRYQGCHSEEYRSELSGDYAIRKGYLEIVWKDYETIRTVIAPGRARSSTRVRNKGYIQRFHWRADYAGWIDDDTLALMQKRKCRLDPKNCFLDCTDPSITDAAEREMDANQNIRSFYCVKECK